ncbi:MAG TPA: DUF5668 domain-containing protein [Thermoleophilia bacterium]|nr:DUF5668 domain-containing protein [Thermoleophilia bacterium]
MNPTRLLIALLLIGLGALLLVANLGYLDWDFVAAVWRLWPLFLVILGVYLLFGRTRGKRAAAVILAVLLVSIALAVFAWQVGWENGNGNLTEGEIQGPRARGIEEASLSVDLGALDLDITSEEIPRVLEGRYRLGGSAEIREQTGGENGPEADAYALDISSGEGQGFDFDFLPFGKDRGQFVELTLADGIAWSLDVNIGATSADIDLGQTVLRTLNVDAGASSLDITVGEVVAGGDAEVTIEGGAGDYNLRLPSELNITLETDAALSSIDIPDAFRDEGDISVHEGGGNDLRVKISTGVSSVEVDLY